MEFAPFTAIYRLFVIFNNLEKQTPLLSSQSCSELHAVWPVCIYILVLFISPRLVFINICFLWAFLWFLRSNTRATWPCLSLCFNTDWWGIQALSQLRRMLNIGQTDACVGEVVCSFTSYLDRTKCISLKKVRTLGLDSPHKDTSTLVSICTCVCACVFACLCVHVCPGFWTFVWPPFTAVVISRSSLVYRQSGLVFWLLDLSKSNAAVAVSPRPRCPHSWWDEIIITGLLMDLQDRGGECIYDCVWVQLCVSPVMPCVQACSQGQIWWVMNQQWQEQGWLGEIQALRPHRGSGEKVRMDLGA